MQGRTVVDAGRWRRSEDYGGRIKSVPDDAVAVLCCCTNASTVDASVSAKHPQIFSMPYKGKVIDRGP